MRVVIEDTAEEAAECVARSVADAIRANPRLVLGVATGRTMEPVYAALARLHREAGLTLGEVRTFNLDEYMGAAREDPWSFGRFTLQHLVEPTDLPASSVGGGATTCTTLRRSSTR